MDKIQSPSISHASSISQQVTIESLNGPHEYLRQMQIEFHKRKDYLNNQILSIKRLSCYKPEGAFSLFPNFSHYMYKSSNGTCVNNTVDLAMYSLNEARIALVPGSAFGAERYMRFSNATSMENLSDAVNRLKEALVKLN